MATTRAITVAHGDPAWGRPSASTATAHRRKDTDAPAGRRRDSEPRDLPAGQLWG